MFQPLYFRYCYCLIFWLHDEYIVNPLGKPALLYDETNPDWVPIINMGYLRKYFQQDRHSRLEQRKRRRLVTEVQDEIENERASVKLVSCLEQRKRKKFRMRLKLKWLQWSW